VPPVGAVPFLPTVSHGPGDAGRLMSSLFLTLPSLGRHDGQAQPSRSNIRTILIPRARGDGWEDDDGRRGAHLEYLDGGDSAVQLWGLIGFLRGEMSAFFSHSTRGHLALWWSFGVCQFEGSLFASIPVVDQPWLAALDAFSKTHRSRALPRALNRRLQPSQLVISKE
jgi:hypothetical protein